MSVIPGAIEEQYAGTTEVEYGLIKWLKVGRLYLFIFIALLLCLAVYIEWDNNFRRYDRDETNNAVTVSDSTVSEIRVTATPNYE